jgi:hypothetical protein
LLIFDRVYVVHLPNVARRLHIEAQLSAIGYRDATYIHAEAPPKEFTVPNMRRNPRAEFGVGLSHIAAVVQAIADGAEAPLFVEDDISFVSPEHMVRVVHDLPTEWDVLYLGGHPREKAQVFSGSLARVGRFSCAEAYSINGVRLVDFHRYWCNRVTRPDAMYDFILGEFAARHQAYAAYPVMTEQAPFVSHIKGTVDDKRALVERGWQNNLSTR